MVLGDGSLFVDWLSTTLQPIQDAQASLTLHNTSARESRTVVNSVGDIRTNIRTARRENGSTAEYRSG